MKYLTIDYIKQHSRIDYDCEDALLELYGSAAEETVLAILRRSLDELKEANDGHVPAAIIQATLLLTDNSYQHRTPSEPGNLYTVPYGFDILIKPHMKLAE